MYHQNLRSEFIMADQKAAEFLKEKPVEDAEAYKANYGAHREGMTLKEVAEYYTQWAKTGDYEEDLRAGRYNGPEICANAVTELYKEGDRESVKLLDVAAGTGFLAERLKKVGFKAANMDALDPAEGMLDVARTKNVYNRLICDFMDDHQLDISSGAYDCLAIAGGMGEGHIPASSIKEMIRCVKPGGYIVIVMREEYLSYVHDYKTLEENMAKLEQNGIWKRVSRKIVDNYSFEKPGVVYVYQIV